MQAPTIFWHGTIALRLTHANHYTRKPLIGSSLQFAATSVYLRCGTARSVRVASRSAERRISRHGDFFGQDYLQTGSRPMPPTLELQINRVKNIDSKLRQSHDYARISAYVFVWSPFVSLTMTPKVSTFNFQPRFCIL